MRRDLEGDMKATMAFAFLSWGKASWWCETPQEAVAEEGCSGEYIYILSF